MQSATGSAGICLEPAEREQLRSMMAERTERGLADSLDLSRTTLHRAAAGLPLRRSMARIVRQALRDGVTP